LPLLFNKIVKRRRGGYCYELNGLFAALLRGLGFRVDLLSAGVASASGGFSPDFDHLGLLVQLDQAWLADVGFGDSFLEPVPFNGPDDGVEDPAGRFRVWREGAGFVLQSWGDGFWRPQFHFALKPRDLDDFAERNRFQQTSPESHFTRGRVCSMPVDGGRVTLSGQRLIETREGEREERELLSDAEVDAVLLDRFGVLLDESGATERTALPS
jgi:N-hydroxyarylamine O-acetyltransferase